MLTTLAADEQVPGSVRRLSWRKVAVRVAGIVVVAWGVGMLSRWIYAREAERVEPAGFLTGMVHGAAMPCALPALVMGADPILYTPRNTGRTYKLGYTVGVNACGAVFFGLTFRRLSRHARRTRRAGEGPSPAAAGDADRVVPPDQYQKER